MSRFLILCFCLLLSGLSAKAQTQKLASSPIRLGEAISFQSKVLAEERVLNVYLPAAYSADSAEGFPVIYLLDGTITEDFVHIAGLVQFANFPWINMLPPCIVVGIANVDRKRDFTYPTSLQQDQIDFPTTGHSAAFMDFLEKEVKPLIAQRYHCADESILIGQSLGGLLAAEVLYKRPELFSHYIIVSPSLWWDDESLLALPLPDWEGEKKRTDACKAC